MVYTLEVHDDDNGARTEKICEKTNANECKKKKIDGINTLLCTAMYSMRERTAFLKIF